MTPFKLLSNHWLLCCSQLHVIFFEIQILNSYIMLYFVLLFVTEASRDLRCLLVLLGGEKEPSTPSTDQQTPNPMTYIHHSSPN